MRRISLLSLLTISSFAASTQAEILISSTSSATPDLPGFRTHIITATSTVAGELITGVDFAGDGSNDSATGRGFFGPMNQVTLLGGALPTIFNDHNVFIPLIYPGHTPQEDSQFRVNTSQLVVPAGFAEEGPNILQAVWAWPEPVGQSVDFAQLVIPDSAAASIFYRGVFAITREGTIVDTPEISGLLGTIFEGLVIVVDADLGIRPAGSLITHAFTTASGPGPITWSNLTLVGAPNGQVPLNPPTLTPAGAFSWSSNNDSLSHGLWAFQVTATNAFDSDMGILRVILSDSTDIPEPSTILLMTVATVGLTHFRTARGSRQ